MSLSLVHRGHALVIVHPVTEWQTGRPKLLFQCRHCGRYAVVYQDRAGEGHGLAYDRECAAPPEQLALFSAQEARTTGVQLPLTATQ